MKHSTYGRGSGQTFSCRQSQVGSAFRRVGTKKSDLLRCFQKAFGAHEKCLKGQCVPYILDGAMEKDFDVALFINVCGRK